MSQNPDNLSYGGQIVVSGGLDQDERESGLFEERILGVEGEEHFEEEH